jgi:hypothetical protein
MSFLRSAYYHSPRLVKIFLKLISDFYNYRIYDKVQQRNFPLWLKGEVLIKKPFFFDPNDQLSYFSFFYRESLVSTIHVGLLDLAKYKLEILKGKKEKAPKLEFENKNESFLPIAIINDFVDTIEGNDYKVELSVNEKKTTLRNLGQNRFHYLPLPSNSKVNLSSDLECVVGKPILKRNKKNLRKKLVLNLFLDGLASEIFKYEAMPSLAPNIHNFFSKGTIFHKGCSNSSWTLASLPCFFTGKYQAQHNLFHPTDHQFVGSKEPLISEVFQKEGYLTFQACGNHRKTPTYGYIKGFDRTIYKQFLNCSDVLSSTIEQLRAFPERSQFVWATFFELHHYLDLIPDISSQTHNKLENHTYDLKVGKSVKAMTDKNKIAQYMQELRRVDFYLGELFRFIEENYEEDEILVTMVSDHGQNYFNDSTHQLANAKINVPMMFRGGGIPKLESYDYVENIDLFPTLVNLCGVDFDCSYLPGSTPKAFGGKEKNFVFTETIFPGKLYTAVIKDSKNRYEFTSTSKVPKDGLKGLINSGDLKVKVTEVENEFQEATKVHPEIVSKYKEFVIRHINSLEK